MNAIKVGDAIFGTIDRIERNPFAFKECIELPTKTKMYRNFRLIKDGQDKRNFASETIKIKKGDALKIECLSRGRFVGVLEVRK